MDLRSTALKMLLLTCKMSYSSVGKQRSSKIGVVRCSQLYLALHRFLQHLTETEKKVAIWTNPVCLLWEASVVSLKIPREVVIGVKIPLDS